MPLAAQTTFEAADIRRADGEFSGIKPLNTNNYSLVVGEGVKEFSVACFWDSR
jgi:hypothetical protein